jgi:hypothetical protein
MLRPSKGVDDSCWFLATRLVSAEDECNYEHSHEIDPEQVSTFHSLFASDMCLS